MVIGMDTLLLENMTWKEIDAAKKNGFDSVIIFAASVEQHGPALPEITDTVLGYAEAVDLAKRLGNTLVAPVIRPGLSKHHLGFPGSLTLRPEVFKGIVEDYIASYVHHGFRRIILSSSHGGNFAAMAEVAAEQEKVYPDVCIIPGGSLEALDNLLIEMDRLENQPAGFCGGHACDWETSLMMMVDENYVRRDELAPGFVGSLQGELLDRFFHCGTRSISDNGVIGDPTGASAEKGKRYFDIYQNLQEKIIRTNEREWEQRKHRP